MTDCMMIKTLYKNNASKFAFRFVDGTSEDSQSHAHFLASKFMRKANVRDAQVSVVTQGERDHWSQYKS